MKNKDLILVIFLYYIGWFGCVFLAKTPLAVVSLVFPLLLLVFLHFRKNLTLKSILFASCLSIIGILFDFLLIHLGYVTAAGDFVFLIPIWLISIWILFSFSMIKIATQFSPPLWVAAILGMIMGPLSYKSGEAFQVLTFSSSSTFLIYAVFWGAAFPLIIYLPKKYL